MSCPTFESLSAELDGELAELEAEAVRSHLGGCDKCRARRLELLVLQGAVRDASIASFESDELKRRLAATVRKRRRRSALRLALGLAAAAVLAVVLVPLMHSKDVVPELVGDHLGTTVKGKEPFDVVSSDPNVVERWFDGKLDFRLRIPRGAAARLLGARLCNVGGRQFPLAAYDREGRRMSLFALGTAAGRREGACQEGVQGFTVCRQAADGIDYMLVSDYPRSEAKRVLTAVLSELR
jgi:anti-sigma factor RsiW